MLHAFGAWRNRMKRVLLAAAVAILAIGLVTAARAVPPVATPSPGYDARLQESREAATPTVTPAPQPKKKPRKGLSQ
jgi:opacity protein-like surface antigen